MTPDDKQKTHRGEPVTPQWQDEVESERLLDYQTPERSRREHRGSVPLNALCGFFGGIVVFYGSLFLLVRIGSGISVAGPVLMILFLLSVSSGLVAAVRLNFAYRRRGVLAGYLLGLGVSILCPIVAIWIICGR